MILDTIDPLNLNVVNVLVDFYTNLSGFLMLTYCNYPEANKGGHVYANNLTTIYSHERVAHLKFGIFVHAGGSDYTVVNSKILTY